MVDALDGPLSPEQQRVLGSLAEKEATVPDTYPMTLRGLQTACNQKNNREPVTDLDEATIQRVLDELKARNLARFVYASHGARTTKFRHVLHERLRLEPAELALLTVLLLRGPQTVNELRTRTERAHAFADNDEVVVTLEALAGRDDPIVVHLPRQPGQKETRWMHLLGDADVEALAAEGERVPEPAAAPPTVAGAGLEARVAELERRVAELEALLTAPSPSTPDRESPTS
ncbi:MAG TPA: YceH family protein [Acidimicrobiales bacterium]|nr:YceH family protein [Acidimicrobiales bacterium]